MRINTSGATDQLRAERALIELMKKVSRTAESDKLKSDGAPEIEEDVESAFILGDSVLDGDDILG